LLGDGVPLEPKELREAGSVGRVDAKATYADDEWVPSRMSHYK
jgi:hypothetical protein